MSPTTKAWLIAIPLIVVCAILGFNLGASGRAKNEPSVDYAESLHQAEERAEEAEKKAASAAVKFTSASSENDRLSAQILKLQQDLERSLSQVTSAETAKDKGFSDRDGQIQRLRNQLNQLQKQLDAEGKKGETLSKEVSDAQQTAGGAIVEKEMLAKQLQSMTEQYQSLRQEVELARKKGSFSPEEVAYFKMEAATANRKVASLEADLQSTQRKLQEREAGIAGNAADPRNWTILMSRIADGESPSDAEVKKLLGPPETISGTAGYRIWSYKNGGEVHFEGWKVTATKPTYFHER